MDFFPLFLGTIQPTFIFSPPEGSSRPSLSLTPSTQPTQMSWTCRLVNLFGPNPWLWPTILHLLFYSSWFGFFLFPFIKLPKQSPFPVLSFAPTLWFIEWNSHSFSLTCPPATCFNVEKWQMIIGCPSWHQTDLGSDSSWATVRTR